MPVLREDSVLIMDGAVKIYRRERSRKWQAAFQIDDQYIRISTGNSDLDEAKQAASDSYLKYKFRQKNGVPIVSKRFSDVAKLCITEMNKQLESGVGKKVYRDYVIVLEKYLIPLFRKMHITSITFETLQKFIRWRKQQKGRIALWRGLTNGAEWTVSLRRVLVPPRRGWAGHQQGLALLTGLITRSTSSLQQHSHHQQS